MLACHARQTHNGVHLSAWTASSCTNRIRRTTSPVCVRRVKDCEVVKASNIGRQFDTRRPLSPPIPSRMRMSPSSPSLMQIVTRLDDSPCCCHHSRWPSGIKPGTKELCVPSRLSMVALLRLCLVSKATLPIYPNRLEAFPDVDLSGCTRSSSALLCALLPALLPLFIRKWFRPNDLFVHGLPTLSQIFKSLISRLPDRFLHTQHAGSR